MLIYLKWTWADIEVTNNSYILINFIDCIITPLYSLSLSSELCNILLTKTEMIIHLQYLIAEKLQKCNGTNSNNNNIMCIFN